MNYCVGILFCLVGFAFSDNPTNCTFEDTVGHWILHLGADGLTNNIDCNEPVVPVKSLQIQLLFPNKVVDEYGNVGTWTMVYNQGFAIRLSNRRYFAFQFFDQSSGTVVSYCSKTFNGWVHNDTHNIFPPQNWGCYFANKMDSRDQLKVSVRPVFDLNLETPYGIDEEYISRINKHQNMWTAGVYEEYANFTLGDMIKRAGGRQHFARVRPRAVHLELQTMADDLPEAFDWRDTGMVSPVRNQGVCGSCYAFGSMAAMEAGVRIASGGKLQPVFSPQSIVSCSNYSQGCEGGFPYLIAGMYGQDFGVVEEDCYPYLGKDTKTCSPIKQCSRQYTASYDYVGGFYGGCNEALMRVALNKVGPVAVSFNVTSDFLHYKGGIFHHTGIEQNLGFNPFELTNHVVLVVGYGVDQASGVKFWTVKNSWGSGWGEDGFFRIRRGTDELGLESLAVKVVPHLA